MEKKQNKFTVLGHCAAIALFVMTALASSSTQDVVRTIDDAADGWQYGRSLTSDATDDIQLLEMDSTLVEANTPLVATID